MPSRSRPWKPSKRMGRLRFDRVAVTFLLLAFGAAAFLGGEATAGNPSPTESTIETIQVLPPDLTPERLESIAASGVRWVLWTESDPEAIPDALTDGAIGSHTWGTGTTRYYAFDLGPPAASAEVTDR